MKLSKLQYKVTQNSSLSQKSSCPMSESADVGIKDNVEIGAETDAENGQ